MPHLMFHFFITFVFRVGTIFLVFNARSGPKKFRARAQKKTHKEKKTHTETQQK